jgi:hypothetical protein
MPTLPAGFDVVASSYGSDDPGGVLRTEVAGGMSRYSLDWDRGPQRYAITLMLDAAAFSVWVAFYHRIIRKGATPFDMPIDSGLGVTSHSVNIVPGSYAVSHTAETLCNVSFTVEAENQIYGLSDAAVSALANFYGTTGRPTLPADFEVVASSYSSDDPGGVMRAKVAGGRSGYALDWDRGPQRYTITLILDAGQSAVWVAFYHRIIRKGAIAFDMPIDSGQGAALHAANLVPGSYAMTRTAETLRIVSFVVEAENPVYDMTEADAQSLVDVYNGAGSDTSALLARIARFATVDTLVLNF